MSICTHQFFITKLQNPNKNTCKNLNLKDSNFPWLINSSINNSTNSSECQVYFCYENFLL